MVVMNREFQEFIEKSGIRVETPSPQRRVIPPSRPVVNNYIRTQNQERRRESPKRGTFEQFEANSPLANEFEDVNLSSNNKKMINRLLANGFEKDVNLSSNNKKMVNNLLAEEFNDTFTDEFLGVAPASNLQISELKLGMFNALVNKNFGKTPILDLKPLLLKRPLDKTPIGEGLYIDTLDIRGKYGQFQPGFSHTKEAGPQGDIRKPFSTVQFGLEVSNNVETKGATVSFFRNGKVRFSGGFIGTDIANQPELIRKFVVEKYTDNQSFLSNEFEFNNLSGQFNINGGFRDMNMLQRKLSDTYRTSYEVEITPMLYAHKESADGITKFYTLNINKSGNVQIIGAKSPEVLQNAFKSISRVIRELHADGQIVISGKLKKITKKKTKKNTALQNLLKSRKTKTKTRAINNTQLSVLRIDSKKCERMPKAELIDLARKMGVVNFRTKNGNSTRASTRKEICEKIRDLSPNKAVTFKNTTKKKNVSLTGTSTKFRVGSKMCAQLPKPELVRICDVLKIKRNGKETKDTLCKLIEKARNNIAAKPTPMVLSPRAIKKKVSDNKRSAKDISRNINRAMKTNNVELKRRMNENSIRNDLSKLYGSTWMNRYKPNLNNDIKNIQANIRNINKTNKLGVPFKRDINAIKKVLVQRWKRERRRELEKKYLMNNANVTGVPYNLRTNYKKAMANHILNKNGKISKKGIENYRKYWLKFRSNVNADARPRGINRAVKARVTKM
jgi:TATA-box binding protein (TBP) (component of TFIID and TFIIIB)